VVVNGQRRFDPEAHYAMMGSASSANVDAIKHKYLDISYANQSDSQKVDIYLPGEGQGPFPVLVAIHGGAFMGGDKRDEQLIPMLAGLSRGYAIVSVNYRLSWEATFPAPVHDVKTAVRWIRGNAAAYGFDPQRIAAWGGSAGGYLALMLGLSSGVPELEDLHAGYAQQPSSVQAVVDWFGPTNFLKMDQQLAESGLGPEAGMEHSGPDSPESLLLGGTITEIPEKVRAANPETYIGDQAAPALIQHGTRDLVVPVQQSMGVAAKLKKALGDEQVHLDLLAGAGHGGPQFGRPENLERVFDFLDEEL
jgi:acetyl esterase/lipase